MFVVGKLQPGENGHSLLEVNQGVESAQSPQPRQTARLNDLVSVTSKDGHCVVSIVCHDVVLVHVYSTLLYIPCVHF